MPGWLTMCYKKYSLLSLSLSFRVCLSVPPSVYVCVWECTCKSAYGTHVEVRGQLSGVSTLVSPAGLRD